MGYPLRILKRVMPHAEFLGWCRFYAAEPFDDERCYDLPAASMQATVANIWRAKDTPPIPPANFLPYRRAEAGPEADIDAQVLRNL
ncbi:MAG: phage tail assembly protein T [Solimonas sp.]